MIEQLRRQIKDIDDSMTWKPIPVEELRILSAVVQDDESRNRIFSLPIHELFFSNAYARGIWSICKELHRSSLLDPMVLSNRMRENGMVFTVTAWSEVMTYCPYPIPSDSVFLDWCERRKSEVLNASFSLNLAAYGREKAMEIDRQLQSDMQTTKKSIVSINMDDAIQRQLEYQDRIRKKGGLEGYKTYDWLDEKVSGLVPSDLTIIAARPGGFKTGLAVNLALQTIKRNPDIKTAFINLEMPSTQMIPRFVQSYHGVTKATFSKWSLGQQLESMTQVFHHGRLVSTEAMHLDSQGICNVLDEYYSHGFRVFFIDYIQLIKTKNQYGNRDDLRIQEAINALKQWKDSVDGAHICCLAQLSRMSETRRVPTMADLAGSSYIEQAAAMILFMYPDCDDDDKGIYRGPEIINGWIAKNRHGEVGRVSFVVDKAEMRVLSEEEAKIWALEIENG